MLQDVVDEKELAFLAEQRTREHAANVIKHLYYPERLAQEAGAGGVLRG